MSALLFAAEKAAEGGEEWGAVVLGCVFIIAFVVLMIFMLK